MKTLTDYKYILSLAVFVGAIAIFALIWQGPWQAGASIMPGGEYQSTTTPSVANLTNLCPPVYRVGMASSTTGTLGSVNVTGGGTGRLNLLDATTSDATLRGNVATSSLYLASFPAGFSTTTPHFDIEFKNGLLVDYTSGVATTTISFRCNG